MDADGDPPQGMTQDDADRMLEGHPNVLTVPEIVAITRFSRDSIVRAIKAGELVAMRLTAASKSQYRIAKDSLRDYIVRMSMHT